MRLNVITSASLLLLVPAALAADEPEDGASYRSDLWKMEFHQNDEDESINDVPEETEDSLNAPIIDAGLDVALDELVENSVADRNASVAFISDSPTESDDIESRAAAGGKTRTLPDRRMGTQSVFSNPETRETVPVSNGPSLLTLFVALVSGVVITSAVFSGNNK